MRAQIGSAEDMGRVVRYVRERHGLTQRDLAAELGVTQRWLSELEQGRGKQLNARYFEVLSMMGIQLMGEIEDV